MTPEKHTLPRVLYLSHTPQALYDVMHRLAEPGIDLITLDHDDDDERLSKLASVDAVIVASYPFTRRFIEATRHLRIVHHQGVGYQDTIDLNALRSTQAKLAITPAGTTVGVAEHAILLTLAVFKRLPFADAELRQGRWHVNALRPESRELAGKIVGYIGMGRIAQAAAQRFRAFDTTGYYYDPSVTLSADIESQLSLQSAALDTVLTQADVLTVHVPLTPDTHHLIDANALALMKQDAIIINTARGPVIDEAALVQALTQGRLAGAGLDVFEDEPLSVHSPLVNMPNTVLTPHISAGTRDAFATKMCFVFANLHRFFTGEPIENEVREYEISQ
jgi:phosphoglycerate dehydrogenase-like enzyme